MDLESWKSQLRKGASELVILSLIGEQAASGTQLLDALAAAPEIGLSDGAMYPLLNRLEREGRIAGRWETPKSGGRGLKKYRLTADGQAALKKMQASWRLFRDDLDAALGERR
ncbi:MAG: PadR family transcriptional regulator [Parvularculaceae bacterium]